VLGLDSTRGVTRDATDHIDSPNRVTVCRSVRIPRGVRISESAFPVVPAFVVASYFVLLWIRTANAYETEPVFSGSKWP
jgi:hypothetical protein